MVSQLSQEMAEVLHEHSACFAISCLGHLHGSMLISIFAGSIVQLDSIMTIGKSL